MIFWILCRILRMQLKICSVGHIIIILVLFNCTPGFCKHDTLNIVTDQAYWHPFTYSEKGQAKGVHIDMVKKALFDLGYKVKFEPKPWKRCLMEAQKGKYDAVVSASYKPQRAAVFYFPDDADTAQSAFRITQVEYVIVTSSKSPYVYNGDLTTLPEPIRAPLGYSIVDDLKNKGLTVFEAPDTIDCVYQLVKSNKGAFITPYQNAITIQRMVRFKGQIRINPLPVVSKSYFIVFPKKRQKLTRVQRHDIWSNISNVREDKEYMKKLFDKYFNDSKL